MSLTRTIRQLACFSVLLGLILPATAAEDLPSYRGADGSGCQADWTGAVVTDAKQAKVLWTSEERHFGVGWGYGVGPENKNRTMVMSCGYSGPVVAGNRVFFNWFVPSGDVVDDKVRQKGRDQRPEAWKIDADDLLVCMDADTGKTQWRAVMPGTGLNWGYHRSCPWTHPCVVDGKVYWLGSAGKVFCHAVIDGKLVWESDTGEAFKELENLRSKMREAKTVETYQKGMRIIDGAFISPLNSSPCYVDGVIVVNDGLTNPGPRIGMIQRKGVGLVGLDAATGKLLWRLPEACGIYVSPVPLVVDGQHLVLSCAPHRLLAIEPKTGKPVWEVTAPMGKGVTPATDGTHILVQRHRADSSREMTNIPEDAKGLSCWQLVGGKPELAWEKEPGEWSGSFGSPVIIKGRGYAQTRKGLVCVDLATGEQVGETVKSSNNYYPLTAANGIILAGNTLVAATEDEPKVLGRIPTSKETYTSAFISAGRVYVRGRLDGYENKNSAGKTPPEPGCIRCVDLRK